ncbi:hypothetical protein BO78DRAFT_209299 [Aspergillus sclerotiicarbonarius CBS 121057]|uniref:Uncharacterized protein n=1 Tax=Aspergillus sclerotiicarbonarius (strain CBS 121057 / IBT 28362) TaxID=1448318 RepID=A0A319E8T8_ASPSB|nr:hypothetical protein BO78DRAFT_209299 [Aspergillus sclerotiicarbonarius CBS 121057]
MHRQARWSPRQSPVTSHRVGFGTHHIRSMAALLDLDRSSSFLHAILLAFALSLSLTKLTPLPVHPSNSGRSLRWKPEILQSGAASDQ